MVGWRTDGGWNGRNRISMSTLHSPVAARTPYNEEELKKQTSETDGGGPELDVYREALMKILGVIEEVQFRVFPG